MSERLDIPAPDKPISLDEVIERLPLVRHSILSKFDDCPLSAYFEMRMGQGWSTHPQARGTIFHRFAAEALREMKKQNSEGIPKGTALAILEEMLEQRDIEPSERVRVPLREIPVLRMAAVKFAADNSFTIANVVDVEKRLSAPLAYRDDEGILRERMLTGQLDVLVADPTYEKGAIVIDWKDAQPLDAKILTPTGWTTMGALRVGDRIVGSDGKPTTVSGVHPKGKRLIYEIEFTDGSRTRCCDHHWWTVRRSGGLWQTKRLQEIMHEGKSRWHVPAVGPVEFDHAGKRPLDPYLLGALLGDGCFAPNSSIGLTSADQEVIDAVRNALPSGMTVRHAGRYDWRLVALSRAEPNPLRASLSDLGLMGIKAAKKWVPEAYLFASADERLELLRGLMDTDGSIDKEGRMSFASASKRLADDVQFIVRSLGGFATLKLWPRKGHHHDTNVVYFRLPQVPFRLARKRKRWHEPKKGMTRSIRSVTPLGVEEVQCIEVAATDMLYVTDDFLVTHNTWALPPERQAEDRDAAEKGLSYHGYFQQRFYGWLVMRNFRDIDKVILREFYSRRSKARPASLHRRDLERVEKELADIMLDFDRCFASGKPKTLSFPDVEPWNPSPGKHCKFCVALHRCPVDDDVLINVTVRTPEEASEVVGKLGVVEAKREKYRAALRPHVEELGPVEAKNSKGRYVFGLKTNKSGKPELRFFVPEGADRAPSRRQEDRKLEEAMKRSVERAKEERKVST